MNHGSDRRKGDDRNRHRDRDRDRDRDRNRDRDRRHRSSHDRPEGRDRRSGRDDHRHRVRDSDRSRGRDARSRSRDRRTKTTAGRMASSSSQESKCEETRIRDGTECRVDPGNEKMPECISQRLTIGSSLLSAPSTSSSCSPCAASGSEMRINWRQQAQQEEKRKRLWTSDAALPTKSSVWHGLHFSTDSQTEKFRKLMGMKKETGTTSQTSGPAAGLQQRQEQLFHDLDQQYAAARSVTHTQRGTGLGFGS